MCRLISEVLSLPIAPPTYDIQELKPNGVTRTDLLTIPGWDSWGKILALDSSFKIETISKEWSSLTSITQEPPQEDNETNINNLHVSVSTEFNTDSALLKEFNNMVPRISSKKSPESEDLGLHVIDFPKFLADNYEFLQDETERENKRLEMNQPYSPSSEDEMPINSAVDTKKTLRRLRV